MCVYVCVGGGGERNLTKGRPTPYTLCTTRSPLTPHLDPTPYAPQGHPSPTPYTPCTTRSPLTYTLHPMHHKVTPHLHNVHHRAAPHLVYQAVDQVTNSYSLQPKGSPPTSNPKPCRAAPHLVDQAVDQLEGSAADGHVSITHTLHYGSPVTLYSLGGGGGGVKGRRCTAWRGRLTLLG